VPADYASSGIYCYVINELGLIYQRDSHREKELSNQEIFDKFVSHDYFSGGRAAWGAQKNSDILILGDFYNETWERTFFDD
jgi:hypothetical protein